MMKVSCACAAATLTAVTLSGCGSSSSSSTLSPDPTPSPGADWSQHYNMGTPVSDSQSVPLSNEYSQALKDLVLDSVFDDIKSALVTSNENWPADFGNYGPFFVRLAWHCSGTYRQDGKGGCGGGEQRFEPVRSWDDNTNLDKARALLAPIKDKYGDALSWGDLIIAAGFTSMREMGTPLPQVCFGRVDDEDGTKALDFLGPSPQQEQEAPCEIQGQCPPPLGSTTVGLIYLNPEGPVEVAGGPPVPDPVKTAATIRDSFGRMENDDRATVALIGAHAFGKSHGPCHVLGAQGLSPAEAYAQNQTAAWQGKCNVASDGGLIGKGLNTWTSGFEGPWTTKPLVWDNEFFKMMLPPYEWEVFMGPGGHNQWRISNENATDEEKRLLRLTSDVALIHDANYTLIVKEFAENMTAFDEAFSDAWFTLTHRGGAWSPDSKCDTGTMPQWILDQSSNRMLDTDSVVV